MVVKDKDINFRELHILCKVVVDCGAKGIKCGLLL